MRQTRPLRRRLRANLSRRGRSPSAVDPWAAVPIARLERGDFRLAAHRHPDFVEPPEQGLAPRRLDLEANLFARGRDDRLLFEIDGNETARRIGFDLRCECLDGGPVENNRQHPVLETVGEKDIAETRRDYASKAHLLKRPHRGLARTAASEVRAREQDLRSTI